MIIINIILHSNYLHKYWFFWFGLPVFWEVPLLSFYEADLAGVTYYSCICSPYRKISFSSYPIIIIRIDILFIHLIDFNTSFWSTHPCTINIYDPIIPRSNINATYSLQCLIMRQLQRLEFPWHIIKIKIRSFSLLYYCCMKVERDESFDRKIHMQKYRVHNTDNVVHFVINYII